MKAVRQWEWAALCATKEATATFWNRSNYHNNTHSANYASLALIWFDFDFVIYVHLTLIQNVPIYSSPWRLHLITRRQFADSTGEELFLKTLTSATEQVLGTVNVAQQYIQLPLTDNLCCQRHFVTFMNAWLIWWESFNRNVVHLMNWLAFSSMRKKTFFPFMNVTETNLQLFL